MAMKKEGDDWIEVTALGGKPMMLRGQFRWPISSVKRRGEKETYYKAISDREFLDIPADFKVTCEIIVHTLSRDETEQFEDPYNIVFRGGRDNPVIEGSTLSWWHVSNQDNLRDQVKSRYKEMLSMIEKKLNDKDSKKLGTSGVFKDEFCYGYVTRYNRKKNTPVPQKRYHCGFNQLIDSYKSLLNITDIEFRIHGTTYYPLEIMHSVLICPAGTTELDNRHPVLQTVNVPGFADERPYVEPSAENVVSVEMNEAGEYRIIWRPFCTRDEYPLYWDHVTFAFLLPPDGPERLPLPVPYMYQEKLNDDPKDQKFSDKIQTVTQNASASADPSATTDEPSAPTDEPSVSPDDPSATTDELCAAIDGLSVSDD